MENLKPFDLEKALAGDPVVTRRGKKVVRLVHMPEMLRKENIIYVTEEGLCWIVYPNGKIYEHGTSDHDLLMAPVKKTLWVAIDKNYPKTAPIYGKRYITSYAYENEKVCRDLYSTNNEIVEIEIEI